MATFDMRVPPEAAEKAAKDGAEPEAVPYVKVELSPTQVVHRAATEEDKVKYRDEWLAFEAEQKKPKSKAEAKEAAKAEKAEAKAEEPAKHAHGHTEHKSHK